MPQGIVMRHRPAHFAHLFASSGYAAGYYVYQWYVVAYNRLFRYFFHKHQFITTSLKMHLPLQGTSAG
jgi:Zn-dependent oligopeptidase